MIEEECEYATQYLSMARIPLKALLKLIKRAIEDKYYLIESHQPEALRKHGHFNK